VERRNKHLRRGSELSLVNLKIFAAEMRRAWRAQPQFAVAGEHRSVAQSGARSSHRDAGFAVARFADYAIRLSMS